jgi:vancomycin resistance protein YoaR
LEFKRLRNDGTGAEATVGRGFFDLKISGDYNTKFDVSPH